MPTQASMIGLGVPPMVAQAIEGVPALVTATGTTQGAAAVLPSACVNVTAAASQTGVILPANTQNSNFGDVFFIGNVSGTTAVIYPSGSETLNNGSSLNLPQYKMAIIWRLTTTQWLYIVTP